MSESCLLIVTAAIGKLKVTAVLRRGWLSEPCCLCTLSQVPGKLLSDAMNSLVNIGAGDAFTLTRIRYIHHLLLSPGRFLSVRMLVFLSELFIE